MKTLFLIHRGKINKTGLTSIRGRITLNKNRKVFSTGIFVHPEYWSKEKQKVLDEAENAKTVNPQISLIKQKLGQAFLMLQIKSESFDVDDIYKIYCGEDIKKEMRVIAAYQYHHKKSVQRAEVCRAVLQYSEIKYLGNEAFSSV